MPSYDLVVYGGNPWAVSAAVSAKKVAPALTVALVSDQPDLLEDDVVKAGLSTTQRLGGIYTAGGEIMWDDYGVAGGTYRYDMYTKTGRRYEPNFLSDVLQNLCTTHGIDIYYGYHLSDLSSSRNSQGHSEVSDITLRPISYDREHRYAWDPGRPNVNLRGSFFIDASTDGRLIRMAAPEELTIGRYDWPAECLTDAEKNSGIPQSATISVRLGGVDTGGASAGEWRKQVLRKDGAIAHYNNDLFKRTSGRLFCGPADWEAENSTTIWATGSTVFNVDPRAFEKDRGTDFFPIDMPNGALSYDEGYMALRSEIASGRWIEALGEGLGMPNLELLAVASVMYVREGQHLMLDSARKGHGTENSNYAVTSLDAIQAGSEGKDGRDGRHYWQRIGVAHYGIDLHAFAFGELYDRDTEAYYWRPEVEERIRPDLSNLSTPKTGWWNPAYGVWLPFEMVVPRTNANLITCGYNVSASSLAWGEIREAPNLCTLGDACGTTIGTLFNDSAYGDDIADLAANPSFISSIQKTLIETIGANIDTKKRKFQTLAEAA